MSNLLQTVSIYSASSGLIRGERIAPEINSDEIGCFLIQIVHFVRISHYLLGYCSHVTEVVQQVEASTLTGVADGAGSCAPADGSSYS